MIRRMQNLQLTCDRHLRDGRACAEETTLLMPVGVTLQAHLPAGWQIQWDGGSRDTVLCPRSDHAPRRRDKVKLIDPPAGWADSMGTMLRVLIGRAEVRWKSSVGQVDDVVEALDRLQVVG